MTQPEQGPGYEIETRIGQVILTWDNTVIRTFLDPQYNHVEYRPDDKTLRALRLGQEAVDWLFENHYPYFFRPTVDDASFEWFISAETTNLDGEWEELDDEA